MNRSLKLLPIFLVICIGASARADDWPEDPIPATRPAPESKSPSINAHRIVLGQTTIDFIISPPENGKAGLKTIVYHTGERIQSQPTKGISLEVAGQNIAQTGESVSVDNGAWSHHQFFSLDAKRQWPPSMRITYGNDSATINVPGQERARNRADKSKISLPANVQPKSFGNKMANQANKMATVENPFNQGSSASVIAERRQDLAAKMRSGRVQ